MNDSKQTIDDAHRQHALTHLEDDVKAAMRHSSLLLLPVALVLGADGGKKDSFSTVPAPTLRALETARLREAEAWGRLAAAVEGDDAIIAAELAKCQPHAEHKR